MSIAETSPTARALHTLELLQRRPGISADELAARLGVTDRAARRYVAILREAGIEVEATRGRYGGYRIGRGMRPAPLVFTATEVLGLVMAVLDGQHAAADPDDPVGAALGKLIQALPAGVARPAATMRAYALAIPNDTSRPDPAVTSELVAAAAEHRRVHVAYRTGSGRAYETDIDPWAVIVRYGRWYVLCFAHDADDARTLRVDRIEALTPSDATFDPPADLDPLAWFEQALGSGWEYEARVVFDASFASVSPFVPSVIGRLEPLDGGTRCRLVGSTNNPAMYAGERLAAIPYPFRVEGGPQLRDAVAAVARRMTDAITAPARSSS